MKIKDLPKAVGEIDLPIQKTVSFVGGFLRVAIPIALFIIFAVVVYHVKSRG